MKSRTEQKVRRKVRGKTPMIYNKVKSENVKRIINKLWYIYLQNYIYQLFGRQISLIFEYNYKLFIKFMLFISNKIVNFISMWINIKTRSL